MDEILEEHQFDYVLDCIDSVSPKLALIKALEEENKTGFINGSWWKTDPSKVLVRDLSKTNNCYLAKTNQKKIEKRRNYQRFQMCFSTEIQKEESLKLTDGSNFKNLLRNHQFYACTFWFKCCRRSD